jgi:hypothetical protein
MESTSSSDDPQPTDIVEGQPNIRSSRNSETRLVINGSYDPDALQSSKPSKISSTKLNDVESAPPAPGPEPNNLRASKSDLKGGTYRSTQSTSVGQESAPIVPKDLLSDADTPLLVSEAVPISGLATDASVPFLLMDKECGSRSLPKLTSDIPCASDSSLTSLPADSPKRTLRSGKTSAESIASHVTENEPGNCSAMDVIY